ncbi:MAG: hypothetical protein RL223_1556 [Pseudomonadota bacterium]|jgi:hypothetical protein
MTPRFSTLALALWLGLSTVAQAQMPGPVPPEAIAAARLNPRLAAGEAWIVPQTTELQSLTLAAGSALAAPPGKSLTLSVDGVETTPRPGRYQGRIVLTVSDRHEVVFSPLQSHPFRQAVLLDERGLDPARSALAAAGAPRVQGRTLAGAHIRSAGENFNGLLAAGGDWTVQGLQLDMSGNGGNDFAGYGAGLMSDGARTRLVVDGARIRTHGAVRTAVVAGGGSHLLVRDSRIEALGGTLPPDYVSNVTPGEMKDAPWMLGIRGNNRATNLLGDRTVATYLRSDLVADGWGVLSVDASQNAHLNAIASTVTLRGESGYGSYAIGNSTNRFLGTTMDVPTHGIIITGGHAVFGASRPDVLAALDRELALGLGAAELAAIPLRQSVVRAGRHAVMSWGDATVQVRDATVFETGDAVFLNKGATLTVDVDGSQGAQLRSATGVILQAIDNDDPGPVMRDGLMANLGVWREPTEPVRPVPGFDNTAEHPTDMRLRFTKTTLNGDFYNAIRARQIGGGFGPDGPSPEPPRPYGANLLLTLQDSTLTGVVSAASARHLKAEIGPADHAWLGRVTNTVGPAINNGVIVRLQRSTWTVTGPSHLTVLDLADGARLQAPAGRRLRLSVDGREVPLRAGRYAGHIVVEPV